MQRRPAAILFLCALLGAFFGVHFNLNMSMMAIMIAIEFIVVVIIRLTLLRIAVFLLFTATVTATLAGYQRQKFTSILAVLPQGPAIYSGMVSDTSMNEDGIIKAIVSSKFADDVKSPTFNILLTLRDGAATNLLAVGKKLRFSGEVQPLSDQLSPIHFNQFRFGLNKNIHAIMTIDNSWDIVVDGDNAESIFPFLRRKIFANIIAATTPSETATLVALMIGNTDLFSDEQREVYKNIGAEHLLAVSGLQLSLISTLIFLMLSPVVGLILPRRYTHRARAIAALFTIIISFLFLGLTGFPPSAVRAFNMSIILLLPNFFFRRIDAFDALYISGFITVIVRPLSVVDLGFLLSYAAVFGLLLASADFRRDRLSLFFFYATKLVISSVAAFLFTLPILVIFISKLAPFAIMANIFLVPLAALLQIPAIAFGLLGSLLNWPSVIAIAAFFANVIEILATFFSDIFGKIFSIPAMSVTSLLAIVVSLIAIFFAFIHMRKKYIFYAAIFLIYPLVVFLHQKRHFEVTVIPVGQGDSSIFSLPSGHHILIDAGGQIQGQFDPGESIVLPSLRHKGIASLDVLIISHPDPDHILGAFAVVKNIDVKEIWHSGFHPDHPLTIALLSLAKEFNVPVKGSKEILGSHFFGETEVQILAPDTFDDDAYFSELKSNDNSLVVRVIHRGHALLWPGDIELMGEQLLLSSHKDIHATVLKAPHHGSKTSSSLALIKAVNPRHVVYSTGRDNRFNFPHAEVVRRYQELGIDSYNTAYDGAITIIINQSGLLISPFRASMKRV